MSNFKFNTSIASLMEYSNYLSKIKKQGSISNSDWQDACKRLLIHLSPICPHITEEIWLSLGNKNSIHLQNNPTFEEKLIEKDTFTLIVQINGKLRDQIEMTKGLSEQDIKNSVLTSEKVLKYISNKEIVKEIYVQDKLYNLVVR